MNVDEPVGIIELGNINIKCLIFKINKNNTEILSTSITPSEGFYNDVVVNLSKATNAIRLSISEAEKKAKISLKKINIVFEQPDFLCTKFSKHKKIDGSKIHKDDIEFLLKEAKKDLIHNDKKQSIVHIFNHNYIVDGKNFVEEPIDVYADNLTHEITFITIPKNNLKNINQVFNNCDIEIEKLISKNFAMGVQMVNYKDLQFGSIIVDLGFEKTGIVIFKNLAIVHSINFPIGINHISKDISKVCSLELEESEKIRNNIDFSFDINEKIFDENNYLKNEYFINSNFRKISKNLVLNVIKARIDEIFEGLKKQMIIPDFNFLSGVQFFITGEGLKLTKIEKYFIDFFKINVKKLDQNFNEKNKQLKKDFAFCLGALKIIKDGWETEAIPQVGNKDIEKRGFFAKIFGIH
tara:strand:- start:3248 stop:4474 length:1227 start_codon:yes stop_codon:yes gene_type:complete